MNRASTPAITVSVQQLPHADGLPLPSYETSGSAGMDLSAAIDTDLIILPGARALVPTGLAIALPTDYEAQIRPRSGLALRDGIALVNSPGTIDADYRGEIGIILINLGDKPVTIERGMRIAQMVVAPVMQIAWKPTESLPESDRGAGGFGSTGVSGGPAEKPED